MVPCPADSCATPRASWLGSAIVLAAAAIAVAIGLAQHRPPAPVPADAPATQFSAARAFAHMAWIAKEPHPAGSPAAAAMRARIADELRTLGLTVELQQASLHWRPDRAATIDNVLGRLSGRRSIEAGAPQPGAVALVAHYDSVSFGPGAADDGSGVATLLEAARAFKSGPRPLNDIIFLFVDGEEGRTHGGAGCRGALGFVQRHPWAKDVGLLINFDARGTQGPAYMYEVSDQNGWLIRNLADSHCGAAATSFMSDLYRSLPLGSDFTRFLEGGHVGYNVAFIGGLVRYHTQRDDPAHLSKASLQHDGTYALTLAQYVANQPLDSIREPDHVYFNLTRSVLVHYPETWAWPLCLMALLLCACAAVMAARRGEASLGRYLAALGASLLLFILAVAPAAAMAAIGLRVRWVYILYSSLPLAVAGALLAAAVVLFAAPFLARRLGPAPVLLAGQTIWALLMVLCCWKLPGASYLFTWPVLFSAAGAILCLYLGDCQGGLWRGLRLALTAAPLFLLLPTVFIGIHACGLTLFSPVIAAFIALAAMLLIPQLLMLPNLLRRGFMLACGAGAAVGLVMTVAWPGFSVEQPKLDCATYALDADTGQACWLSTDKEPDEYTTQFFGNDTARKPAREFYPRSEKQYLRADAPAAMLAAPEAQLISDTADGDKRTVALHIQSPRQAPIIVVYADDSTKILGGLVNGMPLLLGDENLALHYDITPVNGFDLTLETAAGAPLDLVLVDHSYGLPALPGTTVTPRPPQCIMKPNTTDMNKEPLKTDETLVAKKYHF